MNPTEQQQPDPQERILYLEAQAQEQDAMIQFSLQRATALNTEIRLRDTRIAELEKALAKAAPQDES